MRGELALAWAGRGRTVSRITSSPLIGRSMPRPIGRDRIVEMED